MQKEKEKYSKEKLQSIIHRTIKEKSRECYTNLSQEEKDKTKDYQRKDIKNCFSIKKKRSKVNNFFVLCLMQKLSEKTLKFNNIRLNKNNFISLKNQLT